jgi:hypothetical protein
MYRKLGSQFFVQWQLPVHLALDAHQPTLPILIVRDSKDFFNIFTRNKSGAIKFSPTELRVFIMKEPIGLA